MRTLTSDNFHKYLLGFWLVFIVNGCPASCSSLQVEQCLRVACICGMSLSLVLGSKTTKNPPPRICIWVPVCSPIAEERRYHVNDASNWRARAGLMFQLLLGAAHCCMGRAGAGDRVWGAPRSSQDSLHLELLLCVTGSALVAAAMHRGMEGRKTYFHITHPTVT